MTMAIAPFMDQTLLGAQCAADASNVSVIRTQLVPTVSIATDFAELSAIDVRRTKLAVSVKCGITSSQTLLTYPQQ
jgi:hypothetical protein